MMESNYVPKCTHGCFRAFWGTDGIFRKVGVFRFENRCYQLRIETWWDGDEAEPMVSVLQLSQPALEGLAETINVFMGDLERFAVPSEAATSTVVLGGNEGDGNV